MPRRDGEPWRAWYSTARWQRLRLKILTRDLFTCQMPSCDGRTRALVCDHIKPHRGDETLFWNEDNLQTLCQRCHDSVKQAQEQASKHQRGVWH